MIWFTTNNKKIDFHFICNKLGSKGLFVPVTPRVLTLKLLADVSHRTRLDKVLPDRRKSDPLETNETGNSGTCSI